MYSEYYIYEWQYLFWLYFSFTSLHNFVIRENSSKTVEAGQRIFYSHMQFSTLRINVSANEISVLMTSVSCQSSVQPVHLLCLPIALTTCIHKPKLTLIQPVFVLKMSAFYVCCKYKFTSD